MPKVTVTVPHNLDPEVMAQRAGQVVEKCVKDFEGRDLQLTWSGRRGEFHFKSLAFTIRGHVIVEEAQVIVEIDLPFAAMMFKDRVEKAVTKNLSRAIEQTG